jgi:hypothetical protein
MSSCGNCGFSERCHEEEERKIFLMLSSEQQKIEIEKCMQWIPVSCYTYAEPTKEKLEKLKINAN